MKSALEVTQSETFAPDESPAQTQPLDEISNQLAKQLRNDLTSYAKILEQEMLLQDQKEALELRIRRSKQAIEILTGTELPIPGFEIKSQKWEPKEASVANEPHEVREERVAVPVPPPPMIQRDTSRDCPGCGSHDSIFETIIINSRNRRIRVLKCGNSSCNAEYPI